MRADDMAFRIQLRPTGLREVSLYGIESLPPCASSSTSSTFSITSAFHAPSGLPADHHGVAIMHKHAPCIGAVCLWYVVSHTGTSDSPELTNQRAGIGSVPRLSWPGLVLVLCQPRLGALGLPAERRSRPFGAESLVRSLRAAPGDKSSIGTRSGGPTRRYY